MCKAPKVAPEKEPDKPEFLRNRVLDRALSGAGTVAALRTGRSQFRIPLGQTPDRLPGTPLTPPSTTPPRPIGPGTRPIRPIAGGGTATTNFL